MRYLLASLALLFTTTADAQFRTYKVDCIKVLEANAQWGREALEVERRHPQAAHDHKLLAMRGVSIDEGAKIYSHLRVYRDEMNETYARWYIAMDEAWTDPRRSDDPDAMSQLFMSATRFCGG